ncbi:CRISPR-associated helicase Cas3' [Scytonema sp. UIC 10036]|uniref:CRISPR-associated helicase Cas3' n=1 Tax=Scytonema sp. UIC 10036 TaxID=2304196 RepID=UPI0012DA6F28|nr:CRISPR-associated helicase Cas3' [Scytonema sp. UIC 10036]MUG96257.1 CRISPR-associated helicase Cas3' [Scytonema sp. UIC 10036]
MSKSPRQRPYLFGRVFFPSKPNPNPAIPNEIYLQPLDNHVGNVIKLGEYWKPNDFSNPYQSSFLRFKKSAGIHDKGKPQKFELRVENNKNGEFKKYIYSFRGHRFVADSKDIWVKKLARGHHDFSVQDICRDTYELKKDSEYAKILSNDPLTYARELYILEMCDQIEAELACRVIGDEEQAESRTFMDYTISKDESEPNVYRIDPWIFSKDEIELTFKSWVFRLSEDDKAKLQKCRKQNRDADLGKTLDVITKTWWQNQPEKPEEAPSQKVILKPYQSEDNLKDKDCQFWYQQLAGFAPNPMQEEIFKEITHTDAPAFLIKAPTGSGKFESVLFPALAKNYRLILPLPARSLLEDQKQRVEKYLKRFSQLYPKREISLVIDTGSQMYRWVYRDGKEEPKPRTSNPRRHLYKGDVILTTLDKFLYRYFAFGDKQKSFVFPLRIHRNKTHAEKTLICFDEAHTYDDISFTNFHGLVKSLYEAGRSLILMTATMPPEYVKRFNYLIPIDYLSNVEKAAELAKFQKENLKQPFLNKRGFEWLHDIVINSQNTEPFQQRVLQKIIQKLNIQSKRRIIAVVQTVKDAVAIYQRLKHWLNLQSDIDDQELFLYHGRLDGKVRQELYTKLKQRDNDNQPYILITTSAIEVGCDLNSEVLISEICLPENLIQRAGRCNRKGDISNANVIVVGKVEGEPIPFYAQSLDEAGWKKYQETLQSLSVFDSELIGKCISRSHHIDDYRVVELFSMLHDYVYSADLTCQPIHEKGLVITRSWTPSVTLVYDDGTHGDRIEEKIPEMPQVTVPVDRLIIRKDENGSNEYANTNVYERYYDQEETQWKIRPLRTGYAYQKDIIVIISRQHDGKKEYTYNSELGFVDLPGVFIKWRTTGFEQKLQYKYNENDKQKSAVITYIKALEDTP